MTIWRVRVRVMWVTIWYLTMNYLPCPVPVWLSSRPSRSIRSSDVTKETAGESETD